MTSAPDLPPVEVLDGALCGPENAELFDPITNEERHRLGDSAVWFRRCAAMIVCHSCPVAGLCLADALKNRNAKGVYGGVYFSWQGRDYTLRDALVRARIPAPDVVDDGLCA